VSITQQHNISFIPYLCEFADLFSLPGSIDVLVVFPIRIPLPRPLTRALVTLFRKLRILNTPPTSSSSSTSDPYLQASTSTSTSTSPNPPAQTARATDPDGDQDQNQDPEEDDLLEKKYHFPITLSTAPVIGVLLLLASTSIPGDVVRTGIVGSGGVKPYDIMTLFISLVSRTSLAGPDVMPPMGY
jgi:hypothetical protein